MNGFRADASETEAVKPASEPHAVETGTDGNEAIARYIARLIPGFLISVALMQWVINTIPFVTKPRPEADFNIYYAAALALNANPRANIYSLSFLRSVAAAHHLSSLPQYPYLYPPFLAMMMRPLAEMPLMQAEIVWNYLCLFFWLVCALLAVYWLRVGLAGRVRVSLAPVNRLWSSQWRGRLMPSYLTLFAVALGVFVVLTYQPLLHAMILGQISTFVFLLLLIVPWLLRKKVPELAGIALAVATMLKLFPILLIGYYIVRGQWRVALGVALGFGGMVLALVVTGVPIEPAVHAILTNGSAQASFYNNQALSRLPIWLEAFVGIYPGAQPGSKTLFVGNLLIALVAALFVGGLLWIAWGEPPWRMRKVDERASGGTGRDIRDLLGYGWAICTMLLVAPIMWEHYQPWELAPLMICLGYTVRELVVGKSQSGRSRRRGIAILCVLIAAYIMSMNALPFNYDSVNTFSAGPFFLSVPLRPLFMLFRPVSVLLVWGVSGYLFVVASLEARATAADAPTYPTHTSSAATA